MNGRDSVIFLTDKYGKRDRTAEIESISYNSDEELWNINFVGDSRIFHYKRENVKIIKNCLKDKHSATVFDYLLQMAQFSDIKNDDGQNLLVKNLERFRLINEKSVLVRYLNPKKNNSNVEETTSLVFPFGCNNSQFKAVKTALNNQISIIQGPPGTGKTQTILNIIANLLIKNKTALVVSNNNAATANVYEKLASEKYGLGFICATIGNRKNIEEFLRNQQKNYPAYLKEWSEKLQGSSVSLDEEVRHLRKYFEATERVAVIKSDQASLAIEKQYFNANPHNVYVNDKLSRNTSVALMSLLQKIQFVYSEKECLGFFTKLNLKLKYDIGSMCFWRTDTEKVIDTIKATYYSVKTRELEEELLENETIIKDFDPSKVYERCLDNLKGLIAKRYSKNHERVQFKDWKEIYRNSPSFAMEYPVILSTTFSSRVAIGSSIDFLYDYVIMDEASQVDVVTGALALSCAKNAVIVGDKMQLPNVIEDNKRKTAQELFAQTGLQSGYNFINSFLSSLEQVLPDTQQTLLREHYRCHPKIINFCNQQFYGGKLLIMTEDKGEKNVLEAIKTVPGNFCKNRYNQRQIDVIKNEILPKYSQEELENLGIIAPYNNQTEAISSQIHGIDAATVHKYQGREKDNIIISTVDNEITDFSDDANMLNVAVSRAKKRLTIVISGNDQPKNSNLMALVKYIQYNNFSVQESKICSIFDFFYVKQSEAKFKFLNETKKISKFDSENAMNILLSRILEDSDYLKYGFVFEMPLKNVISRTCFWDLPQDLKEYANKSWSHVDFVVYNKVTKEILFGIEVDGYSYHKKGSRQAERDEKKNRIFEFIGLPLLRFSTRGSDEESKIRAVLNSCSAISRQIV